MPPGPFFNGPFRYLAPEGFWAGTVGLEPLVDFGLLGVGLAFGLAGTVGLAVGFARVVTTAQVLVMDQVPSASSASPA